ncbi:unnamed protein product [Brassicogethes aeneus]|uniref:ELM2 domain-containing protein n=1 Tax=Brassicogethes aeneus TaxID=1431903 RepID=A0A9P0BGV6_BRAAE|nr:unnamed protein product [Brassicogethes aeneus]
MRIKVEVLKRGDSVTQCYRCQKFGHGQDNCGAKPMCVKCGEDHQSFECQKAKTDVPTFANCRGEHTANSLTCRKNPNSVKRNNRNNNINSTTTPGISYAQAINNHQNSTSPNQQAGSNTTTDLSNFMTIVLMGNKYQAELPEFQKTQLSKNTEEKSSRVWLPTEDSIELDEYMDFAKTKHNYSEEQALTMAFFHRYDYEKAKQDLANYSPVLEEWTQEDKAVFRRGLKLYIGLICT